MNRKKGWILLGGLTVSAFLYGKFQGGYVPWFLFYAGLVLYAYVTSVAWLSLRRFHVERHLSARRLTAGERVYVRLTFRFSSWFPLSWLLIRDESELAPVAGQRETGLLFPLFRREGSYEYVVGGLPRGIYRFSRLEWMTGDLFGFVEKKESRHLPDEVVVYPRIRPIHGWRTVNERHMGRMTATHHLSEDVTSVVGVRDYANRDRLSRIHWKATARGQGLKVKEFERHVTNDLVLVLDCQESVYGAPEDPLFERAVSLTASLAHGAVSKRYHVGLIAWGMTPTSLPMGRTQDHLFRLLEPLALIRADGHLPLEEVLLREGPRLPQGTTLVVVTPKLDDRLVHTLCQLAWRQGKAELFRIGRPEEGSEETDLRSGMLRSAGIAYTVVDRDDFEDLFRGGVSVGRAFA